MLAKFGAECRDSAEMLLALYEDKENTWSWAELRGIFGRAATMKHCLRGVLYAFQCSQPEKEMLTKESFLLTH